MRQPKDHDESSQNIPVVHMIECFSHTNVLVYATADEAVAYMFYRCFLFFLSFVFFLLFPSAKNMRQPFSGTAERIFMKLLPNDTEENGVCNVVPPPGE